jgi:hypothetical protein
MNKYILKKYLLQLTKVPISLHFTSIQNKKSAILKFYE